MAKIGGTQMQADEINRLTIVNARLRSSLQRIAGQMTTDETDFPENADLVAVYDGLIEDAREALNNLGVSCIGWCQGINKGRCRYRTSQCIKADRNYIGYSNICIGYYNCCCTYTNKCSCRPVSTLLKN